ncbi:MAG: hypothetical protein ACR2NU_14630, partial [Aeoliella sp.]
MTSRNDLLRLSSVPEQRVGATLTVRTGRSHRPKLRIKKVAPMSRLSFASLTLMALLANTAWAQPINYTHTSGPTGDGFTWTSPLGDFFSLLTPDDVEYFNQIGDDTYFDDQYVGTQAASGINGDAWWGNPDPGSFGVANINFLNFNNGEEGAMALSFDFAWATSDDDAETFVSLYVEDIDGLDAELEFELGESFTAYGNNTGAAGRIAFDVSQLINEDDPGNPIPLVDIASVAIFVGDAAPFSAMGEFAIDNVVINGDTTGAGSNVRPTGFGASTKFLRDSFNPTVQFQVVNDGVTSTTYSATLDASSDTEFFLDTPPTNVLIAASQTLHTGPIARIDKNEPSGTYLANVRVSNDLEPIDPDEIYPYTVNLY